jgi:uncharacterized protein (TIGR00369 family)
MMESGENYPPIGHGVRFTLLEVRRGNIRVSGVPGPEHYNPFGVVHGGFAGTLLDLALGHVSVTVVEDATAGVSTTDLSVKYLRSICDRTGTVYVDADVIHAGKRIIFARATLRDAEGMLHATAESTCLVLASR